MESDLRLPFIFTVYAIFALFLLFILGKPYNQKGPRFRLTTHGQPYASFLYVLLYRSNQFVPILRRTTAREQGVGGRFRCVGGQRLIQRIKENELALKRRYVWILMIIMSFAQQQSHIKHTHTHIHTIDKENRTTQKKLVI